jgi:2-iminobutanoate/2-iminopropanoate deaminase
MSKQCISTDKAAPPAGGYSQAVVANGLLFIAGQGPITLGGEPADGSFEEQAQLTFDNLKAVAVAAGASLQDAVRVGVYLRDMQNFRAMDQVFREHFGSNPPARTTIQSDLPGIDIEVDAVLLLPDQNS